MRDLRSKVAYLQGLSAGMDIDSESKEGRILNGIIGVLDEFAQSFGEIKESQDHLEDYLETIDEDLFHIEEDIYNEPDNKLGVKKYMEVECPRCGEKVCFDPEVLDDEDIIEITCPNCDEVVFINDADHQSADLPEHVNGSLAPAEDDF